MGKILTQLNKMVKEVYICEICNFAYGDKRLAEKCQDWCKKYKSCSLEITKYSMGGLKQLND